MNLQIFICFHKKIHPHVYKASPEENEKYITFYGVRDKDERIAKKIIYEYELEKYNPILQKNTYNEGSCIYHVYTNKLYDKYDYIGFFQYDMVISENFFKNVESKILVNNNTIFYYNFFPKEFFGGQTTIIEDYPNIPAGLKTYNKLFNTNYTSEDLIRNKMNTSNTFIIPKKMYEKMMSWLIQYFRDDIRGIYTCKNMCRFNAGHIIEALTSMFLALEICEGAVYEKLDIKHPRELKFWY